jgi:O-antigen ligase
MRNYGSKSNYGNYLVILLLTFIAIDGYIVPYLKIPSPSHFIFLALVFYTHAKSGYKLLLNKELYILLIFTLMALMITVVYSTNLILSAIELLPVLYYVIIAIYVYNNIDRINITSLYYTYSISLILVCLVSYFGGVSASDSTYFRFSYNENYNPTWLAAHLVGSLILGAVVYSSKSIVNILVVYLISILTLFFLLYTQSRTSIFALLISIGLVLVFGFITDILRNKLKRSYIYYTVIIVVVISIVSILYINIADNLIYLTRTFDTLEEGDYDRASAGRSYIWSVYLNLIVQEFKPVGFGLASIISNINTPHNNYLLLVYELGVVPLLLWLYFHFSMLVKSQGVIEKSIGLFFFIFSIGNDMITYKYYWLLVYIYIVIIKVSNSSRK